MAGLAACKAGVRCSDVDAASRDIIKEAGYGNYYIHGTGHGVGTEVHEAPTLNPKSEEVLEEYMPVTVEPGIYIAEEGIGIRLENDVLIGETENIDLLGDVPLLPDDIERLMAR